MSSETVDEVSGAGWDDVLWFIEALEPQEVRTDALHAVKSLIAAERADAEMAQREIAENWRVLADAQRERADGLERKLSAVRDVIVQHKTAFANALRGDSTMQDALDGLREVAVDEATRPYRMAAKALRGILEIGKRDMSNPKYDGHFNEAREALAGLTDADIEAARKEDGRE